MTPILAHSSNYTKGRPRKITKLVFHYTGSTSGKDTAEDNGKYFQNPSRDASAHYFVDEDSVVQSVPELDTAWHAGNWDVNCESIGIEMCARKDAAGNWYLPASTVNHAQYLGKCLMKKYDIPLSGVIRHYDVTGKKCPAPLVDEAAWQTFKQGLVIEDEQPKSNAPVEEPAAWARDAWQWAANEGILDGTRPADPVTRQELAVILSRLGLV